MAKLPEPDWLSLHECARRAEQAFATHEPSKVRTVLVAAFRDGKIDTRGRCRSWCGDDTLKKLGKFAWNRAKVGWQVNKFAIPASDQSTHRVHIFLDVEVHREGLARWINGAADGSQRGPQEPAENLTPKPSDREEKLQRHRKPDVEADAILKNRIEMVLAKARTKWPKKTKRPGNRTMAKYLADNHKKELGFKFEAIRQILKGTYAPSERLGIPGL